MSDCIICAKHQQMADYCGEAIAERGGWALTHFPELADERATRGRLLVEPRRHIAELTDMSAEEAMALGGLLKEGARLLREVMGAEHVYVFRINDKVAHLHFHLVPRYPGTPRDHWGVKILQWPERPIVRLGEIRQLAAQLRRAVAFQ